MRDEEETRAHELIDDPTAVEKLDEPDGSNVPERVAGIEAPGPRAILSASERRKRRQSMSNLLAAGRSDDDIADEMEALYGMSAEETARLRDAVLDKWAQEDFSRGKHLKAAARRRIYDHIQKAALVNQFQAVAGLERTLAAIEGTEEPRGGRDSGGGINVSQTIIAILGDMTPEALQEYISAGAKLFREQQKAELPSGEQITVTRSKR
jgi:hypothetical protein